MAFYKDGVISIPNVTGDIVITATAVAQAPHYTNLADPTSENWKMHSRIDSKGTIVSNLSTQVTNAFQISVGDVIRIKNCGLVTEHVYKSFDTESSESGGVDFTATSSYDETTKIVTKTILTVTNPWARFTLVTSDIERDIIITRNEEIPV